jgi:hypothetical protein
VWAAASGGSGRAAAGDPVDRLPGIRRPARPTHRVPAPPSLGGIDSESKRIDPLETACEPCGRPAGARKTRNYNKKGICGQRLARAHGAAAGPFPSFEKTSKLETEAFASCG